MKNYKLDGNPNKKKNDNESENIENMRKNIEDLPFVNILMFLHIGEKNYFIKIFSLNFKTIFKGKNNLLNGRIKKAC